MGVVETFTARRVARVVPAVLPVDVRGGEIFVPDEHLVAVMSVALFRRLAREVGPEVAAMTLAPAGVPLRWQSSRAAVWSDAVPQLSAPGAMLEAVARRHGWVRLHRGPVQICVGSDDRVPYAPNGRGMQGLIGPQPRRPR